MKVRPMIAIGILFLFHATLDVIVAVFPDIPYQLGTIILGCLASQISLLSLWTVLGRAPFTTRFFLTGLGALAISLVAFRYSDANFDLTRALNAAFAIFTTVVQLTISVVGVWLAYSIIRRSRPSAATLNNRAADQSQFGLRQMLIWIACFASVFAVARLVIPRSGWDATIEREYVLVFLVLSICNALLVTGTIAVALYLRSTIARIVGLTATCVVVGLIDEVAIDVLIPGGEPGEFPLIYVSAHLVVLLLSMGWVRYLTVQ